MKFLHLTDEQLQAYLDGDITDRVEIERHLQLCKECQKALNSYKSVYYNLEHESLPEVLSEKTIDKILYSAINIEKKKSSKWETILVIISLIISFATSFYFVNPAPKIAQLYNSFVSNISQYLDSWSPYFVRILPILLVAIIILVLFDLADKKFIRSKTTSSLLNGSK
jgi:anti-sigma factor RsiW